MDPWHDYLALPIAPLILGLQGLAFASPRPRVAAIVGVAGFVAILAMLLYVFFAVDTATGADIGGGLLLVEAVAAAALMSAGLARAKPKGARPL